MIIAAALPAVAFLLPVPVGYFPVAQAADWAVGEISEDMRITRADRLHLLQIFLPILLILFLLLTPKDEVGCNWAGSLFGAVTVVENGICRAVEFPGCWSCCKNAAGDASAAGWWAAFLVAILLFIDKDFRAKPRKFVDTLSDPASRLQPLSDVLAVTLIDVYLTFTGLSKYVAIDILGFLLSLDLGGSGSVLFQFICPVYYDGSGGSAGNGDAGRAGLY